MHSALFLAPLAFTPFALSADDGEADAKARFAPPVQLTAGGENHTGILYPSPMLQDLDGDGTRELLIGEIFGTITASHSAAGGSDVAWTKAEKLEANGEPLKLNNW